ncbi:hypothetical protein BCR34DRAFT_567754 [Clohesyomyces aquaticus]|uniref:Zn(2)-C6 fungal-type domain-containing protein n=1 Tax=Clohesyomyces aquaticus TaxID=1231657 RepID=A0A1Y1ZHY8_9PLEO|nr:hypothetical protein BCR34DRAFT_567754 [Clohesyomyces aquaticus]
MSSPREDWQDWIDWSPAPTPPPVSANQETPIVDPIAQPSVEVGQERENFNRTLGNRARASQTALDCGAARQTPSSHRPSRPLPVSGRRGHNFLSPQRVFKTIAPKDLPNQPVEDEGPDNFVHYTSGTAPKRPRIRERFDEDGRASYKLNRTAGACARCRIRKITCDASLQDICPKCAKGGVPTSLCIRTKVKDLDTYQSRGLAQTFVEHYNESIEVWDAPKVRVKIWLGFGNPFTIDVYRYRPRRAIIDLFWREPNGWQNLEHSPYGIQSETHIDSKSLDDYVHGSMPFILERLDSDHSRSSNVFSFTMRAISEHSHLCMPEIWPILQRGLLLWSYIFLQYHALWQFSTEDMTDKLGMRELVLHNHDVHTLTQFHGTAPLPRLLHQQIHACIEGRMRLLDASIVKALDTLCCNFRKYRKTDPANFQRHALGLYLCTWLYLSILEELEWDAHRWEHLLSSFDWPLERTPSQWIDYSRHAAHTVYAYYDAAMDSQSLSEYFQSGKGPTYSEQTEIERVVEKLSSHQEDLERRKSAIYSKDIRSLELKFSSLLLRPSKG